jgi:hypothetical protein
LRTPALLALGAVALLASATLAGSIGVFAIGQTGTPVPQPVESAARPVEGLPSITVARVITLVEGPLPARPPRLDRFIFIQPHDVALLVLPSIPDDMVAPLRDTLEPEVASPWSTETRPELAPPASDQTRVSAWNPETLLRRLPQSRPPIRDFALARRLAQIAPGASKRVIDRVNAAKVVWPPAEIAMVAIKDEKTVDMYGRDEAGKWKLIHRYRVFAASGGAGPKLRQGDKQVPEGIYGISYLNPHSRYHVSLRVNYPNAFDRKMAAADGRRDLGGDIMIHGKALSVGCLAVGDEAAEEIFWLAAEIGQRNMRLIIAPTDFRRHGVPAIDAAAPQWLPKLYSEVSSAMTEFPTPPPQKTTPIGLLSFFGN